MFCLSSTYYDVVLFVILLKRFIYVGVIQTRKTNFISQIYQIMIVSILKNLSHKYFSYYIIKFIGFILIYFIINLNIISSYIIYNYLYIEYINLL